jgi:hypothetical protein
MSHTIYAAKFEQTIIHQHVHLRRESQSHAPACANDIIPSRKIARLFTKRKKDIILEYYFMFNILLQCIDEVFIMVSCLHFSFVVSVILLKV